MASKRLIASGRHVRLAIRASSENASPRSCFARSMTTEVVAPAETMPQAHTEAPLRSITLKNSSTTGTVANVAESNPRTMKMHPPQSISNPFLTSASVTTYDFPSMEPAELISYPGTHLLVPLRKDILHRAVIFEGDKTRSGTASTKWRGEVHGSNKKIRPQKGTGSARLGDKKSPMLRGGGVAFGPKPRDFSTDLPRKIYDLAWRTALSYRYKKGELIVVQDQLRLTNCPEPDRERYLLELLKWHKMDNAHGRTLFIASKMRSSFFNTLQSERMGKHGRVLEVKDVDVKDLLELGRVVVEREALMEMLRRHQNDVARKQWL